MCVCVYVCVALLEATLRPLSLVHTYVVSRSSARACREPLLACAESGLPHHSCNHCVPPPPPGFFAPVPRPPPPRRCHRAPVPYLTRFGSIAVHLRLRAADGQHRRPHQARRPLALGRQIVPQHPPVRGTPSVLGRREKRLRGAADGRRGGHQGRAAGPVRRCMRRVARQGSVACRGLRTRRRRRRGRGVVDGIASAPRDSFGDRTATLIVLLCGRSH